MKPADLPTLAIRIVSTGDSKPPVIFSGICPGKLQEHCHIRIPAGCITLYNVNVKAVARILDWTKHGSKRYEPLLLQRFNEGELDDQIALQIAADALQLKCVTDGAIIRQILQGLRSEPPTTKQLKMMSQRGGWEWCARLDLHGHSAVTCGCFMKEVMKIVIAVEAEGEEHEALQSLFETDKELKELYLVLGGKLMTS